MTVLQKQCLLAYMGYYTSLVDGIWGDQCRKATEAFQHDFSLTVDGVFGQATAEKILDVIHSGEVKPSDNAPKTSDNQVIEVTGTFWDSIKHFTRDEFKCKCGGKYCNGYPAEMQEAVVRIADAAREHFGKPAHVVSGLRCRVWNSQQGGVANSQHQYGEAIDLRIDGVDSETLRQFVCKQPNHRYSYRINDTNVHFDIPAGKR